MWLCKVWNHSWKYVGDIRTCKRCGKVEDFLGFKLELNRTDLRAVAYDRATKKTFKEDWPLLLAWLVLVIGLSLITDSDWVAIPLFILFIGGFGVFGAVLGRRVEKELESLVEESQAQNLKENTLKESE